MFTLYGGAGSEAKHSIDEATSVQMMPALHEVSPRDVLGLHKHSKTCRKPSSVLSVSKRPLGLSAKVGAISLAPT